MSDPLARDASALAIAGAVKAGRVKAVAVAEAALARIESGNPDLNAFTDVTRSRALAAAAAVDAAIAAGRDPGPLAGVPFAVKNLFDVAGLKTLAGSKINRDHPPASRDATAVARLAAAGGVLVGALNMDEYAYGFTTENSHYGPCRNPHDRTRIAGGSSGGSAAAVAGGLVPLTLGSDTNGSIRVPSSFCGTFGLKPTYGRLSRAGAALFVSSLDHIGPFARSVTEIATVFDVLQGPDAADPVCADRPLEPVLPAVNDGIAGLRIAVAGDYFARGADPEVLAALATAAQALGVTRTVVIPEATRARAAAFVITASEGANLHLADLKSRPQDFDPLVRDRLLAGALVPNHWYVQAQRFRTWYRDRMRALFRDVDVILAPATPCVAPPIGTDTIVIAGVETAKRPNLGIFTQPISFVGLPVLAVPMARPAQLPIGIQVIAAPYREALALRVGAALEAAGVAAAPVAQLP